MYAFEMHTLTAELNLFSGSTLKVRIENPCIKCRASKYTVSSKLDTAAQDINGALFVEALPYLKKKYCENKIILWLENKILKKQRQVTTES